MSHYRFIREEKAMFPVATLCRVHKVATGLLCVGAPRDLGARDGGSGVE